MHGVGGRLLWLYVCADGSGPPGTLGHDVIEVRAALIVGVGGPPLAQAMERVCKRGEACLCPAAGQEPGSYGVAILERQECSPRQCWASFSDEGSVGSDRA